MHQQAYTSSGGMLFCRSRAPCLEVHNEVNQWQRGGGIH